MSVIVSIPDVSSDEHGPNGSSERVIPHPTLRASDIVGPAPIHSGAMTSSGSADLILAGGVSTRSTTTSLSPRPSPSTAAASWPSGRTLMCSTWPARGRGGSTFGAGRCCPVSRMRTSIPSRRDSTDCTATSRPPRDAAAYLRIVEEYALRFPDRPVIEGSGWEMSAFPGGTPSRTLLDGIVADRPVVLDNRDGHGSWVNSVALSLAGIDASTPDPRDGRIEREVDGTPQGTLHEGAMFLVRPPDPEPTEDEWLEGARIGQAELHRFGITAWQEARGAKGT